MKEAYQKVNEKFESVLVFHVGESAGFFSEYNCMILVMLYCLQHKIQFKLYSRDANFGIFLQRRRFEVASLDQYASDGCLAYNS